MGLEDYLLEAKPPRKHFSSSKNAHNSQNPHKDTLTSVPQGLGTE